MSDIQTAKLKLTLPNFPEEILRDWLLPYAKSEGWPPSKHLDAAPNGRWRYLLGNRTISQLRCISWCEESRHISIRELREDFQDISAQIALGAIEKQTNPYSSFIPDLPERFNSILEFLRRNGTLPRPPVLLSTNAGMQVLDGNHRLAAYFYAYGYFRLPLDEAAFDSAASIQRLWIGTSS